MQNKNSKIYFVFGLHNHQPVGNLSSVFKQAFSDCYLPFLSTLERFPSLKAVIHNSGALYDFGQKHFSQWLEKLKKLNQKGQVEIVGGGYFEPIFPIISQRDRIGQIRIMNQYLKDTFGKAPLGCWIPERVWEPSLAKTLNESGFSHTYLDQANFPPSKKSNKSNKNIYLTEDQGYPLNLFVIDELLADKIPFIKPEEVIELLISYKKEGDLLVTFFCDGEKFGLWPGSYDLIYNQGWLDKFFTLLARNPEIETITSDQANQKFAKKDLVYLETSTYPKMQKWALNYKDHLAYQELVNLLEKDDNYNKYKQFIKAETFNNFFIKYPRLNFMHKRMLKLSAKINSNLDQEKDKEAFINLWQAQANCTYWHGIFGGFYLPHLRKSCYHYLIKAENYLDKKIGKQSIVAEDINFDSYQEIFIKGEKNNYIFSESGGSLEELSLKKQAINLVNTINRVKEPYHDKFRQHQFSKYLLYDNHKKVSLVDHLLKKELSLKDFRKGSGIYSLADKPYQFRKEGKQKFNFSYQEKDLSFLKKIDVSKGPLEVEYIFNQKKALKSIDFGIEFNLSLSGPDNLAILDLAAKELDLTKEQDLGRVSSFTIFDRSYQLKLNFSFAQAKVYLNPIYSLSSSESGEEILWQQLSVLFYLDNQSESFNLKLDIDN
ncbi:MAG: DUF1926 domain-containing protein [Candidatus Omnitrophica bacterium]|nr:DUF1926 domain-containing protein [Candidatus Omnitrophota bacterium]